MMIQPARLCREGMVQLHRRATLVAHVQASTGLSRATMLMKESVEWSFLSLSLRGYSSWSKISRNQSITKPPEQNKRYPFTMRDVRRRGIESGANRDDTGSIHVIIGPMFSGKTSRLLRETDELERQGEVNILLLKSDKDTRYSSDHIVSHDGILKKCFAVRHLSQDVMSSGSLKEIYDSSNVVAIDEAQFFGRDLVEFCTKAAEEDQKRVIVAGLDGDFTRCRFGYILDMIPLADTVTKLTGQCHFCNDKALFSKRILGDCQKQEEIGGSERYVPVCRRHYGDCLSK